MKGISFLFQSNKKKIMLSLAGILLAGICVCLFFVLGRTRNPEGVVNKDKTSDENRLANGDSEVDDGITENEEGVAAGDISAVAEQVRPLQVQVNCGSLHGSGTIWTVEDDNIIVVTAGHVLEEVSAYAENDFFAEDADGDIGSVMLANGQELPVQGVRIDQENDLGWVCIKADELEETFLLKVKECLPLSMLGSDPLPYSTAFALSLDGDEMEVYSGIVELPRVYVENVGRQMLYIRCYAEEGMSGGGVYDEKGNYLGLITGGTQEGEMICVPADVVAERF